MYIPVMAFVTYILLSTLIAGLNGKFEPQLLGITFSNASVIIVLELLVLWLGRYFLNINSESQIYDLVAYSGYKFVGVIVTVGVSSIVNAGSGTGGWVGWAVFGYTFMANAFFLVTLYLRALQSTHMLTSIVAPKLEVRPTAVRSVSRQPFDADHRALSAVKTDAIPLYLQLRGAVRIYVVAERIEGRGRCSKRPGIEVETGCLSVVYDYNSR